MQLAIKGVKKVYDLGHSSMELTLSPVDEVTIKVMGTKVDRKVMTISMLGDGPTVTFLDAVLLLPTAHVRRCQKKKK